MASSARIDELRKKFDENPRRYFAPLANEYRKVGDLEQAIFICQEYLPQQPGHMSGHIVYGQALFEAGRHEEARAVFETALALDPENLIALRHLGDIARAAGDSTSARSWYQRVLEADPRNDEIGSVLKELGGVSPSVAAADAAPPAEESIEPWARAEASQSDETPQAEAGQANEPTLEIEQTPDSMAWGMIEPTTPPVPEEPVLEVPASTTEEPTLEMPSVPSAEPAHAEEASAKAGSHAGEDLLDIGDFNIGAAAAPSGEGAEVTRAAESAHDAEQASELEVVDAEALAFEADPYAIAAKPVEQQLAEPTEQPGEPTEQAAAAHGGDAPAEGLLDDALDFELPQSEQASAPSPAPSGTMEGLQAFDGSLSGGAVESPAAPPVQGFYVEEPLASAADLTPAHGSSPIDGGHDGTATSSASDEIRATPSAPAEMFVTETMAQLYLEQGHLEAAVDTYRRLVANRPDDAGLRASLADAERRLQGPAPTVAAEPEERPVPTSSEPAHAAAEAGPTIREFLAGLFGGGTATMAAAPAPDESMDPTSQSAELTNDGASSSGGGSTAYIDDRANIAESPPNPPSTVTGSVDALFSGLQPSASDEKAAAALAQAFAPEPHESLPLKGMPARRASDELSLGHVFKSKTPARSTVSDFSFDQFFADEMTQAPTATTESPAAAPSASDDVAQFSAWLNGLKKT